MSVSQGPSTVGSPPVAAGELRRLRQLRIVYAPEAIEGVRAANLSSAESPIGRAPGVDGPLGLNDPEVSRLHAKVTWDGEGHFIEDAKSRNGTYVNGKRIERVALRSGDVVRIGATLLLYLDHVLPRDAEFVPETPGLFGNGVAMMLLRGQIAQVAPRDISVLILGETGVGKERIAEAIHKQSGRVGAFVPVNCGALPEALAESELFGHVAGAFTGAGRSHDGLVRAAQGGTLFLDEVGELPASVQAKLLRALATGEVRPVGSSDMARMDVRIIAATLRDLESAVEAATFRADLFARLSGWQIRVPPLRDRREDVLPLAQMFLARHDGGLRLSVDAAEALLSYEWPFNVRELEQEMAAAAIRARDQVVLLRDLPERFSARLGERLQKAAVTDELPLALSVPRDQVPTADGLNEVMKHFGGNIARVAEYFGKDRRQIYRWADRYEIDITEPRK